MCTKRTIFTLCFVVLASTSCECVPASVSSHVDFDPNVAASETTAVKVAVPKIFEPQQVIDFLQEYNRLRQKKSDLAMQLIGTIGLVSGALKVEEAMRENLYHAANELIDAYSDSTAQENINKLLVIEETIERDKASVAVLNSFLQFARKAKNFEDFQEDMQQILKEVSITRQNICVINHFFFFQLHLMK